MIVWKPELPVKQGVSCIDGTFWWVVFKGSQKEPTPFGEGGPLWRHNQSLQEGSKQLPCFQQDSSVDGPLACTVAFTDAGNAEVAML